MVVPWSVRVETKARYYGHDTLVIPNGISPDVFPENQEENPEVDQPGLARRYGPDDSLIEAKKANLVKFQKKTGLRVDPDAILFYWPSRLDPVQKGVDLLEDVAQQLVDANPGVQIAVVGDPVGGDNFHADVMGRIAYASGGEDLLPPLLAGPEHARLRRRQRRLRRVPVRALRANRCRRQHLRRDRHQPRHRRLQRQDRPAEPAGLGAPDRSRQRRPLPRLQCRRACGGA